MRTPELQFQPVIPDRWEDFERLFEGRGGPKFCWCMPFRPMTPPYGRADTSAKKQAMFQRVTEGTPIGILAYSDGEPVAWCSIAPLETYKNLRGRGYVSSGSDTDNVWCIACFFIQVGYRRHGVTALLAEAAVEYAKTNGAKIVEAYPVDYDSPSYSYMGRIGTFERLGFKEIAMAGTRRHIMRLLL